MEFSGQGAPAGVRWGVEIRGRQLSTNGPVINATVLPGNYSFTSPAARSEYATTPSFGIVVVSGGYADGGQAPVGARIAVTFGSRDPGTVYPADRFEAGLPRGLAWSASPSPVARPPSPLRSW